MKILITGATGFIGSNIANELLNSGHIVYATHRTTSSFEKCSEFKEKIFWINTDNSNWIEQIKKIKPDQIIHTAWGGIQAENRNNWEIQIKNFWLSKKYFDLAKECNIKKVIALGSQAEYGAPGFSVSEDTVTKPEDAYGAIKKLTSDYLRILLAGTSTEWYWIRVFSVFGEGENPNWLIPSVITKLLSNNTIELTKSDQQYNYIYVKDFVKQFLKIVECEQNKSGIYNLCNKEPISIKELLLQIAGIMGVSYKLLAFGSLPYRSKQNMLITGNNIKFHNSFNIDKRSYELAEGLINTIEYYKKKLL